jgi:hypothetical protein
MLAPCVVCFQKRSLLRADDSSRGVLPSVVCLSVIVKPQFQGQPGPLGAVSP